MKLKNPSTRLAIARPCVVYDISGRIIGTGWLREHGIFGDEVDIVTNDGGVVSGPIAVQIVGDPVLHHVIVEIQ